jgi:formylglycine-generating enzyme required for sulfatase activity
MTYRFLLALVGLSVLTDVSPPLFAADAPPLAIAPFNAEVAKRHQDAWAKHLSKPVEMTNSIGMKLKLIPPGEFDMGSKRGDEKPIHRVRITRPFYLGRYHASRGQFQKFVEDQHYRTDAENFGAISTWRKPGFEQSDEHPVLVVSWNDAAAFCKWLSKKDRLEEDKGYRLPTEAEWEWACRSGSERDFYYGDDEARLSDYAWYDKNSGNKTHPVGQKKANAYGLYDMGGNAWQWCADWYSRDYYSASPTDDPKGPVSGTVRVLRGGSCVTSPYSSRSADRSNCSPDIKYNYFLFGFRVAMTQ